MTRADRSPKWLALLAVAVAVGWSGGCHPTARNEPVVGGPAQRPSPSTWATQTVALPLRFNLIRRPAGHYFSWDTTQTRTLTIRHTPTLVVGKRTELRVVLRGKGRPKEPGSVALDGGLSFTDDETLVLTPQQAPAAEAVEATVIIFETDVPPGHLWSPTSDRYRELHRDVIRQPIPQ